MLKGACVLLLLAGAEHGCAARARAEVAAIEGSGQAPTQQFRVLLLFPGAALGWAGVRPATAANSASAHESASESQGRPPNPPQACSCALQASVVPGVEPGTDRPTPAPPRSPARIEGIVIKRLDFVGDCPYELTFLRDGAATLTVLSTTFGVLDRTCKGTVEPQDFAALAGLLEAAGFFDMRAGYYRPDIVDQPGVVTIAFGSGRFKKVSNIKATGPPELRAIEQAIDALGRKVAWTGGGP